MKRGRWGKTEPHGKEGIRHLPNFGTDRVLRTLEDRQEEQIVNRVMVMDWKCRRLVWLGEEV